MRIIKTFEYQDLKGFKFGSARFGKPKMFVHSYFIDGLLMDTGQSNMREPILEVFKSLPVKKIFLSHHHEDHSGNLAATQKLFNCPTYAAPTCVEMMKNPPHISLAQYLSWGPMKANHQINPIEGQIETENYQFKIIPTPGHSRDHVCLYEKNKGWLFSFDLYVYHYIKYFMRAEGMAEQIESIKKVLKLDFKVLFCSHNGVFEDGRNRLEKKLQFFEDFYGQASRLYHKGHSANNIMQKMNLKENWNIRLLSQGNLSTLNMIKAVIRDEQTRN